MSRHPEDIEDAMHYGIQTLALHIHRHPNHPNVKLWGRIKEQMLSDIERSEILSLNRGPLSLIQFEKLGLKYE